MSCSTRGFICDGVWGGGGGGGGGDRDHVCVCLVLCIPMSSGDRLQPCVAMYCESVWNSRNVFEKLLACYQTKCSRFSFGAEIMYVCGVCVCAF